MKDYTSDGTLRSADTGVHAPITEAADPEEKQQEEEDSMEGTHTVSAPTADTKWLNAMMQTYAGIFLLVWANVMCACILQWAVKDVSTSREAKRFSPTFTIGGYPWYESTVLLLHVLC